MRILLPIDDSESSQRAVQMVIAQARPGDTEVRVLYVRRPPNLLVAREMVGYDAKLEINWEMQTEAAEGMVENVAARLRAAGLKASSSVEPGEPKPKILEVAEQWRADLIVMGSDPPTRLEEYLGGGIPAAVARRAHCSVEIVRAPQKEYRNDLILERRGYV
jgi:nucleotide-binding universal stress UspA family protein